MEKHQNFSIKDGTLSYEASPLHSCDKFESPETEAKAYKTSSSEHATIGKFDKKERHIQIPMECSTDVIQNTDSMIWMDKALAIDHQYAIYPRTNTQRSNMLPLINTVGISGIARNHAKVSTTENEAITIDAEKIVQVSNANSHPGINSIQVVTDNVSGKLSTISINNKELKGHQHSVILEKNIPSTNKEGDGKKSLETETHNTGVESKTPAYRMLVQRRSVFEGINLNTAEEEQPNMEDSKTESTFMCGYCLKIYFDENSIINHLLTHNRRPLKMYESANPTKQQSKIKIKSKPTKNRIGCAALIKAAAFNQMSQHVRKEGDVNEGDRVKLDNCSQIDGEQMNREPHDKESGGKCDSSVLVEDIAESFEASTSKKALSQAYETRSSDKDTSRHSMVSVGKRNAKKRIDDNFITFETKRKKLDPLNSPVSRKGKASNTNIANSPARENFPLENNNHVQKKNVRNNTKFVCPEKTPSSSQTSNNRRQKCCASNNCESKYHSKSNFIHQHGSKDCVSGFQDLKKSDTAVTKTIKEVHSEILLRCITCKGCFLWKWPFLRHLKIHPNDKPYECFTCKKRLFSFFSYVSHIKYFHNPKKVQKCPKCDRSFGSAYLLKLHLKSYEGESSSSSDNKGFLKQKKMLSKQILKDHSGNIEELQRPIKCRPCGKIFRDRRNLWIHQKRHPNAVKPYKCQFCSRRFAVHKWLTDHIQRHTPVRNYPCGVCGKRYFTKSDATMHEHRHTKEATFSCSECDKKFIYKSELKAHLKRHQGIRLPKNIVCDVCNKPFATRRDLERHMTVHTGEKPFSCPVCTKSFSQEVNMQVHVRIHSGERPYQCDLCEKRFITKSKLTRHRLCHSTPKGMLARPYKCVLCPRKYTAENSLIRHLRTHKNSPETITGIMTALNKAVEESSSKESSSTAGAVLGCMIDQAISDARRMARRRKKQGGLGDSCLAEIIDQAIHNSKASSSTQTPIVIENFNNTYVNIQLPPSVHSENAAAVDDTKSKNAAVNVHSSNSKERTASSCADLIKLINEALIKYNDTVQELIPSSNPANEISATETVAVDPKTTVICPDLSSSHKQSSFSTELSPLQMSQEQHAYNPTLENSSIVSASAMSDDPQQVYVHTLDCPDGNASFSENAIVVTPAGDSAPEQYIAVSQVPEQFIIHSLIPSTSNSCQENVLPVIEANNIEMALSLESKTINSEESSNSVNEVQHIYQTHNVSGLSQSLPAKSEQSVILLASSGMKSKSQFVQSDSLESTKVQHIIVKTTDGQTFLIPSTLISLNENSELVMTTMCLSHADISSPGSCSEPVDQIIKHVGS